MPTHVIKFMVGKLKTRVGKLKKKFLQKMFAHHGLKLCRRPWSAAFYCAPDLFLPEFSTRNQTVYCVLGISDKFDDVCRRMVLKMTRHWAFKARLVHQCETHIYVDVCD